MTDWVRNLHKRVEKVRSNVNDVIGWGAPVICFHVTCLYQRKWRHRELTWGLVKQMKWSEHRPSLPPRLLYSRMLKKPRVSDHALLCEMLGDVAGP